MVISMSNKTYIFNDSVDSLEVKSIRKKLRMTQQVFADFVGVSVKTVASWEISKKPITGPIVPLIRILNDHIQFAEDYHLPAKTTPLRLWYMLKNSVCTIIDVNEKNQTVKIVNYTQNKLFRAFGINDKPSFKDYEEFLKSRCFLETHDELNSMLNDLGVPVYDPLLIIEKTAGRMADDDFWIKVERES